MKIVIDKTIRRTILKWLQAGVINTEDLPVLNEVRNNWFEQLMKEVDDEEPVFSRADIDRIEKLSQAVTSLKFPTRADMLEAMEREDKHGNM